MFAFPSRRVAFHVLPVSRHMRNACLALISLLVFPASAVEVRVASFNIGAHFGTTYFDYSLGDPGTPDHESVKSVLARINADVVALQEIHTADVNGSPNDLENLAAVLGYAHVHVSPVTGAFDPIFRVAILSKFPFLAASDIVSPPGAAELSRLHPMVKIDVPGTTNDLVMASVHLKAETALADRFRRAVEMKRLVASFAASGLTNDDNFVVLGDFNPSSINATFTALPATGLPGSYVLGSDMTFPISYSTEPTTYFSTPGTVRLDPRQLDGSDSTYNTTVPNGPTLDLMLVSPSIAGRSVACEVYNSALDVSNGVGLAKAGAPPAANTSATASDHYAVFADLNVEDAGPYVFNTPGQTVTENFNGFSGNQDPMPWVTTGGFTWRGIDAGSSSVAGLRSYGTISDPSLGFLPQAGGTSASATFVNQSSVPLTALQIALDCEQWRGALNGTADSVTAELATSSGTIPLAGLSFSANTSLPNGPVAGGATTSLGAVATGLSIPPGASFQLRVSFNQGAGGGVVPNDVFVNEFHYDNAGDDAGEFVEISVAPGYTGSLSALSLLLYNGNGGTVYGTHALNTFSVGDATPSGHRLFYKLIQNIQNGDPDGFAVVNTATSQVMHFISYKGFVTATAGLASGMTSTDIGVSQNAEVTGQASLGLTGTGGSAADFTWTKFSGIVHSPGQANNAQNFILPTLPSQGLAIDNVNVTFLSDHDQDGLLDPADADDDNDGQADAYENAFGSDPLDTASRFLPVLARAAAVPHGLELSFPGAQGISYTVESSTTLSGWQDLTTVTGDGQPIVVPLSSAGGRMFFRVRAGSD